MSLRQNQSKWNVANSNDYKIAALNATPIVNWFSSTYTPELRPAIEKFDRD